MGTIERILSMQIEMGVFYNEDSKVSGIARRAIDYGFDSLSEAQKNVLNPFLSKPCSGQRDPGGHSNNCEAILEGMDLSDAYEHCDDPESLQCELCREEAGFYAHQWESFSKD
ncbi:hypothetical protein ACVQ8M_05085 [Edwardsiella tarda]